MSEQNKVGIVRQILASIFRHSHEDAPRNRLLQITNNVFFHLHPVEVRRHGLRLRFTWGMGGISFLTFLVTLVTGVILMFYYRPTGAYAYEDMLNLEHEIPFGMIMRNMHRWAAHAMVIVVWFHMLRVFLSGSYKTPRQFNWGVGVVLLVLTLLLSFTGYLLPWDQLAMWAVTVGTNMAAATPFIGHEGPGAGLTGVTASTDLRALLLGDATVGDAAILRFYVLHCIFLPVIAIVMMVVHFWRIRKDGGISGPDHGQLADDTSQTGQHPDRADGAGGDLPAGGVAASGAASRRVDPGGSPSGHRKGDAPLAADETLPDRVTTWPYLLRVEMVVALVVMIVLTVWSITIDAPLEAMANPTLTPDPSKAPWYFLGLQELLVYFDPWIAGVMMPLAIITGLIMIPYVDFNPHGNGYYTWRQRRFAISVFLSGFLGLWIIPILVGTFFRGPGWNWYWPWESWDVVKVADLTNRNLSDLFGVHSGPGAFAIGGTAVLLWYGLGVWFYRRNKDALLAAGLDRWRYAVVAFFVLSMAAIPLKIILRQALNIQYVWITPWFRI